MSAQDKLMMSLDDIASASRKPPVRGKRTSGPNNGRVNNGKMNKRHENTLHSVKNNKVLKRTSGAGNSQPRIIAKSGAKNEPGKLLMSVVNEKANTRAQPASRPSSATRVVKGNVVSIANDVASTANAASGQNRQIHRQGDKLTIQVPNDAFKSSKPKPKSTTAQRKQEPAKTSTSSSSSSSKSNKPQPSSSSTATAPKPATSTQPSQAALLNRRPEGIGSYINGEPVRGMVTDRIEQRFGTAPVQPIQAPTMTAVPLQPQVIPTTYAYNQPIPVPQQPIPTTVWGAPVASTTIRGTANEGRTMVRIENLHPEASAEDVERILKNMITGQILTCQLLLDSTTNRSLGIAQIVFERRSDALLCIQKLNGAIADGQTLRMFEVDSIYNGISQRTGMGISGLAATAGY